MEADATNETPWFGDTPGVVVVAPTYNEADNIAPLADAVLRLSPDYCLLVVDDSSPDGTSERVAELSASNPRIRLLQRPQREGYGRALAAGLAAAARTRARRIVMMDADGSHDPASIPHIVEALDCGADTVVGSRYIEGGGTRNWSFPRRMLSRGANHYSRWVLDLPVRDYTSGFRGFRAETLHLCDPRRVHAKGYAFHIEFLHHILLSGMTAVEVPIQFTERASGRSKLSWKILTEAVVVPWRIRLARRS